MGTNSFIYKQITCITDEQLNRWSDSSCSLLPCEDHRHKVLLWKGCVTKSAVPKEQSETQKWCFTQQEAYVSTVGLPPLSRGNNTIRVCALSWINTSFCILTVTYPKTYPELLSQELMGNLLFLISCPAAEVWKQLLPVRFVFGLDDVIKNNYD